MAVMEIRKIGDPVLKEKAQPVAKITKRIKKLLEDMAETMYAARGVGLAAPQVGESLRMVVIDAGQGLLALINPVILHGEGTVTDIEGCLSIPGMYGEVPRYERVTVEYTDPQGKKCRIEGTGLLARALQHEIDHLEGVLFVEKAQTLSRSE